MSEPVSLIEKFGIPDEGTIVVLDDDGEIFKKLTLSAPSKVTLQRRIVGSKVEMIIIRIKDRVDYKQLFERLKKAVKQNGIFWVVIPRQSVTTNSEATEKRNMMFDSAKDAKLEVGNTIAVNEEEQAVQFMIKAEKN
ncbi:MAG: hypothetical protein IIB40_05435 [Candidatus Marinimicrobia bacterium]|nr:hypothetical protein [Candidatus Neomarinimicrobiota bacterium]MCH7954431.1 hypothetical protein [Candidatus Neomarinimicrobiota bacterium]